jgi:hypothetical protein
MNKTKLFSSWCNSTINNLYNKMYMDKKKHILFFFFGMFANIIMDFVMHKKIE